MHLSGWQWFWLALAAFCSGLAKTGIAGLGILPVALFANVLPARASVGALLPLLVCGDVLAVLLFRRHADWSHLRRLFPWVVVGVLLGYVTLRFVRDSQMRPMIGFILLAMLALHWWRGRRQGDFAVRLPHSLWFTALMGILAGFNTMVANAAGPVMIIYLLSMDLPKLVFVGTSAWFFLLVNVSKVPFFVQLGIITPASLQLDAVLVLALLPAAWLGPRILQRINQRTFERMALILTLASVVRLLW